MATVICPSCGGEIISEEGKCSYCGNIISNEQNTVLRKRTSNDKENIIDTDVKIGVVSISEEQALKKAKDYFVDEIESELKKRIKSRLSRIYNGYMPSTEEVTMFNKLIPSSKEILDSIQIKSLELNFYPVFIYQGNAKQINGGEETETTFSYIINSNGIGFQKYFGRSINTEDSMLDIEKQKQSLFKKDPLTLWKENINKRKELIIIGTPMIIKANIPFYTIVMGSSFGSIGFRIEGDGTIEDNAHVYSSFEKEDWYQNLNYEIDKYVENKKKQREEERISKIEKEKHKDTIKQIIAIILAILIPLIIVLIAIL